jgi:hypothetical protein
MSSVIRKTQEKIWGMPEERLLTSAKVIERWAGSQQTSLAAPHRRLLRCTLHFRMGSSTDGLATGKPSFAAPRNADVRGESRRLGQAVDKMTQDRPYYSRATLHII